MREATQPVTPPAEQTREMIARFEASISKYASEKTKAIDEAAAESYESIKAKTEDLDSLICRFKKEKDEESESE